MATKMGHGQEFMIGAFLAEASYDAGVTMDNSNSCSMKGLTIGAEWPDDVPTDLEELTGSEYPTEQTINEKRVKAAYGEPKAHPNALAVMGALAMGSVASVKDGAVDAWRHDMSILAAAGDLPSTQIEHKIGGVQYAYKGIKCNSLKISGEAGGFINLEAELMGSGTRATSATAFSNPIVENWMKLNNCLVWIEDGSDITIAATPTQEEENISSATPDDVKTTIKSFDITWNNNLEEIPGMGGAGVLQDIQMGRRALELAFTLRFSGAADFNRYINQLVHAIEFNLAGSIIDAGVFKYGADIRVPSFKIAKAPVPQAGPGDSLEATFETVVMDDGTNDVLLMSVFNAQAAYLV